MSAPAAPGRDGSAAMAAFDEPTQCGRRAAPPSQRAPVDPTVEMFSRLESVTTLEELQVIVHPADLFAGYRNNEEIYTTVKRRLTEIAESTTTYLQLAAEEDSMSCFALEPERAVAARNFTSGYTRQYWLARRSQYSLATPRERRTRAHA